MKINKKIIIEDLENLYNLIITFIVIMWLFSGFGFGFIVEACNQNHYLIAILIAIFDLCLASYFIYKRYFIR